MSGGVTEASVPGTRLEHPRKGIATAVLTSSTIHGPGVVAGVPLPFLYQYPQLPLAVLIIDDVLKTMDSALSSALARTMSSDGLHQILAPHALGLRVV